MITHGDLALIKIIINGNLSGEEHNKPKRTDKLSNKPKKPSQALHVARVTKSVVVVPHFVFHFTKIVTTKTTIPEKTTNGPVGKFK